MQSKEQLGAGKTGKSSADGAVRTNLVQYSKRIRVSFELDVRHFGYFRAVRRRIER